MENLSANEKIILIEALKEYIKEHKNLVSEYKDEILISEVLMGKLKATF